MKNNITFCIVDDISTYANNQIQNTIKNILDFTISNLYAKGYNSIVGKNEDELLRTVKTDYAVVMSPGTEYINGDAFFEDIRKLCLQTDFFIAGHILDRTMYDAYYELHHQCYVINMTYYKNLECPIVGSVEKNVVHTRTDPVRSTENWHGNYTPKSVVAGINRVTYKHRCHGWNLLRLAFDNNYPVIVFNERIRNNKKHYYPESEHDYNKQAAYIDYKFNYCKEEFVHIGNTELSTGITETYEQIVIPASGTLYLDLIEKGCVIFYDYNQKALDYWQENCPKKEGIEYKFINTDLLNSIDLVTHLNPNAKTLVNLSNIFCYEGTAAKYSLNERIIAEQNILEALTSIVDVTINFSVKANAGH
jgi:hypothetical protein